MILRSVADRALSHSRTGSLPLSDLKKLAFNIGFILQVYHL